ASTSGSVARRTPTTHGLARKLAVLTPATSRSGSMRRRGSMATKVITALAVLVAASTAHAQNPAKLTIGIFAPTVEFGTAQARLAYAQGLAKAIEQNTGIKTEAQSYATLAALKKDNVDFAIVDGPCFATNLNSKLL